MYRFYQETWTFVGRRQPLERSTTFNQDERSYMIITVIVNTFRAHYISPHPLKKISIFSNFPAFFCQNSYHGKKGLKVALNISYYCWPRNPGHKWKASVFFELATNNYFYDYSINLEGCKIPRVALKQTHISFSPTINLYLVRKLQKKGLIWLINNYDNNDTLKI